MRPARRRLYKKERWTPSIPASRSRRGDALLDRPGRDLGAGAEAELVEDVLDVGVGGALGDHELVGDLAVGQPPRDQGGDLDLAVGQRVGRDRLAPAGGLTDRPGDWPLRG